MKRPSPYLFYTIVWLVLAVAGVWLMSVVQLPFALSRGWRIFIALNLATFVLYLLDKLQAQTNGWRVPETILWLATLLGGSAGALLAIAALRHKNRKISFLLVVILILLLQLFLIGYFDPAAKFLP